jgi:hypothetical protein
MAKGKGKTAAKRTAALPGIADAKIEAIEEAGMRLGDIQEARMRMQREEKDCRVALGKAMHEAKCKKYKLEDGRQCILKVTHEEKAYVRRARKAKGKSAKVDVPIGEEPEAAE